jgi:hypothetical protein
VLRRRADVRCDDEADLRRVRVEREVARRELALATEEVERAVVRGVVDERRVARHLEDEQLRKVLLYCVARVCM